MLASAPPPPLPTFYWVGEVRTHLCNRSKILPWHDVAFYFLRTILGILFFQENKSVWVKSRLYKQVNSM